MMTFKSFVKKIIGIDRWRHIKCFLSDESYYWYCTHTPGINQKAHQEAWLVVQYHMIEKGLTMPNRHLAFGKSVILSLMSSIENFHGRWPETSSIVFHAIGVIKAYFALHKDEGWDFSEDSSYWNSVRDFINRFPDVPVSFQKHVEKERFYATSELPFPAFARSRHSIRNYSELKIQKDTIVSAIALAMTAPSACNRQHARVYCIANKALGHRILDIQGGNRGFGHLADKVLIVTSELSVEMGERERFDPFVNGGIFLMNLCYALHYYKIAHCILSGSIETGRLEEIRVLASIPRREVLVGILSCGIAPDSFDIAASPRKDVCEILTYME